MEDISDSVKRVLDNGLPDKQENLGFRTGRSNIATEVKAALGSSNEDLYVKVAQILYGGGHGKEGLLSSLKQFSDEAGVSVNTAWSHCRGQGGANAGTQKPFRQLSDELSQHPLSSPSLKFAENLQEPWRRLNKIQNYLQDAEKSLAALKDLLDKHTDPCFDALRQQLSTAETEYDNIVQQRETLENDYETRRIEQRGDYRTGGNDWLVNEATPYRIKEIWKTDGKFANATQEYIFDQDNLQAVKDAKNATWKLAESIKEVQAAQADGGSVQFPGQDDFDRTIRQTDFRETEWGTNWMTGQKVLGKTHDVSRHRPFFMIYARQQAILKALSKTGGQWQTERQKKDNISGAAKFRDDLDTTRELVRETANVVKTFQTRVVSTMIRLNKSLILELQNFHANLYFGDNEDQYSNLKSLQKSVQEWQSVFDDLNSNNYSHLAHFQQVRLHDRFGKAEIKDNSQIAPVGRKYTASNSVILGIDAFDVPNSRPLRLSTSLSGTGMPDLAAPNIEFVYHARAQTLELPHDQSIIEWGVKDTQGRDMQPNIDFPIEFKLHHKTPPTVLCWIYTMEISNERNYRLHVEPINITAQGFTLRIFTWSDTKLLRAMASWAAYPPHAPHLAGGRVSFRKRGTHSEQGAGPAQHIKFPDSANFTQQPKVFAGISAIDIGNYTYTRFRIDCNNISKDGMRLSGHSWADTDLYKADVTYLAIDERLYSA